MLALFIRIKSRYKRLLEYLGGFVMCQMKNKPFLILLIGMMLSTGCIDPSDYVKYVEEDPPEPAKPVVVEPPGEIPDQGEEPKKPGGSAGIIPGNPEDGEDPVSGGAGNGGAVVIPEKLALESVVPSSGDVRGGYEVRLHGTCLDKSGTMQFGALDAPALTYVNTKVVRAKVPEGKKGCVDIVWNQDGETLTLKNGFCYVETIAFSEVVPDVVVSNTATELVIHGSGFDDKTRVYLSDGEKTLPIVDLHVVSGTELRGLMPVLKEGMASVYLLNGAGEVSAENAIKVLPEISLSSLEPSRIEVGKSTEISIAGKGFWEDVQVRIGSEVVKPDSVNDSKLVMKAPSLSAGHYDVLVYDGWQQSRLDKAIHYYNNDGSPQVLELTPAKGSVKGGTSVTIHGVNLPISGDAMFDGQKASVKSRTSNTWMLTTPAHEAGFVDVAVGEYDLKKGFEYTAVASTLKLDSIKPEHAVVADGNTYVVLKGSGFTKDMSVSFGPWESESVSIVSSGEAKVLVPKGSGTVPVTVSVGDKTAQKTFTYDDAVSILGITPAEAVLTGSTHIDVYGTGFAEGMKIQIAGEKLKTTIWHPGHLSFYAPAHDVGTDDVILLCKDGKVCGKTQLTWFDSSGINTSAFGSAIDGQLHVTVLTVDTAVPIEGATVYIGSDLETALKGTTDKDGRVSFFDKRLKDAQIVIACAPEHSCNTLQPINATNVTLFLEDWHADDPPAAEDNPPSPPPEGDTINPVEVSVPYKPEQPYFSGTVGSFGKFELVSNPAFVKAGLVMQSSLSPYMMSYDKDDVYLIREVGGKYKLKARSGDVALALVCGLYDTVSGAFYPKYIGVKRHLFVSDGAKIVNHLECPIPLNQNLSIKLLDPPLKSGPNGVRASAYIFVGDEGYIGGFMGGESKTDLVVITGMPPLRDSLSESSFAITAGAYTDGGYPASVFYEYNVVPDGSTLEVGPAAPIPVFYTKSTDDILATGVVSWSVEHPENVDFYAMTIRSYGPKGSNLIWQFYMPGNATSAEFPKVYSWPEDHSETLYIQLTAYKSIREGFDFNKFSTGDTRHNYIHSSATSTLMINDPANEPPPPGGGAG